MNRVLMLNMSYLPLGVISWMKAICLLWQGKAEIVENGSKQVRSPSVTMTVPYVIKLKKNIYIKRRSAKLSRKNLLHRDDYTCQYCGKKYAQSNLNMDHVKPRSKGGKTVWENVVLACLHDNSKKGDKTPWEAGMRLLKKPENPNWSLADEIQSSMGAVPDTWKSYIPGMK